MAYATHVGPIAIAHRGGAALAPENTLVAFGRAWALGLRYLETDIRLTRDGQLVCFHDATLDRVSDGRGPVGRHTLEQLRAVRVGGEPICTLAEALAAFPKARFTVDVKEPGAVAALAAVLDEPSVARRVCAAGAWDGRLARLRELAPNVHTALGWRTLTTLISCSRARVRVPHWVRRAAYAHVPIRLGRLPVFADRIVPGAHAHGINVIVWTVDDAPTMHRLLDAGVDGIISDRPDVLREVFLARGIWHPMGEGVRT